MLGEADFQYVAREARARSGQVLSPEMSGLIEQRLMPIARREGLDSVSELLNAARTRHEKLAHAIADALVQSETRFFRDRALFDRIRREILPPIAAKKGAPVKVWCAGASTGQEAYSIAILVEELRHEGALIAADILATDVSERLLDKARSGLYTQFEIQRGLPIRKLIANFEKAGDLWRISDRLRASVRFEQHNLLQDASRSGTFDVILCCNVLSAFDTATKRATVARLSDALEVGGVLMLGHGEVLPESAEEFVEVRGVYVKKRQAARAAA